MATKSGTRKRSAVKSTSSKNSAVKKIARKRTASNCACMQINGVYRCGRMSGGVFKPSSSVEYDTLQECLERCCGA